MTNVYDFMKDLPPEKRLTVNDLLFAEYRCPLSKTRYDMWTHHNYFVYVIRGKKKWFSRDREVLARAGDCIFVRKGAHSIYQYFEDDFCSLFMFIPDEFIRKTLLEHRVTVDSGDHTPEPEAVLRVETDQMMTAYFYSFLSYISKTGNPDKKLASHKFRELILMIASGPGNKQISGCFRKLCNTARPSLQAVMESNFTYPMKLSEYARLSGRSLSTFRRDFKEIYDTTPGRWLTRKRLDYGRYLLDQTGKSVTEVVFDCGFKNLSHFSRVFRKRFGRTPLQHRKTAEQKL